VSTFVKSYITFKVQGSRFMVQVQGSGLWVVHEP
jgi:hypothetical protein